MSKPGGAPFSHSRGTLIGVSLSLLIGLAIYPLRGYDYELEFLLVLPVVYAGVLAGRRAALTTAVVAVVIFHIVTRYESTQIEEDIIAFVKSKGRATA